MSKEFYFVVSQFDTDANVDVYDKAGLMKEIEEWKDEYDHQGYIQSIDDLDNGHPAEWQGKRLIIKGKIIVPKPKKIVETFEID